jgi:hypothetical protein
MRQEKTQISRPFFPPNWLVIFYFIFLSGQYLLGCPQININFIDLLFPSARRREGGCTARAHTHTRDGERVVVGSSESSCFARRCDTIARPLSLLFIVWSRKAAR